MSIEVLPYGMKCNLKCTYCYEEAIRCHPDHKPTKYDAAKMHDRLDNLKDYWVLFGGEALLMPLSQLEDLLKIGFANNGRTGVQTNATLITERHVELFAKYNTHCGISMDGPEELNDARWVDNLDATRKMTARSVWAYRRLVEKAREIGNDNLVPSFIINLHKLNCAPDRLPKLLSWLDELDGLGIRYAQYHFLDLDYQASDLYLPPDQLNDAILALWRWQDQSHTLKFSEFSEMLTSLRGGATHTCIWHACDPWNTVSVEGLNGDGTPTQCGRAGSNDGVDWTPAEGWGTPSVSRSSGWVGARSHERQMSLYVTPQEHGGCKDCRFWMMCMGHCPGSGLQTDIDKQGDWRLRSTYCESYKAIFSEGERRLLAVGEQPVSLWTNRKQMEDRMFTLWSEGREPTLVGVVAEANGSLPKWHDASGHGDHADLTNHHGDTPHGDSHGDHTDQSL